MKTTRTHFKGNPFTRDIPDGCKTRSNWAKEGFILKDDAKPAAWILMGDNYHEFAVFSSDHVIPGHITKPKKVTAEQLRTLFKRYQELVPTADDLIQEPGYYYFDHIYGIDDDGKYRCSTMNLSGHYDTRSGRMTIRGSREKAFERLTQMIAKEEGKAKHDNSTSDS